MKSKGREVVQNKENIVQVTLRMPEAFHTLFSDFVYEMGRGIPKKDRPSAGAVALDAIRQMIKGAIRYEWPKEPGLSVTEKKHKNLTNSGGDSGMTIGSESKPEPAPSGPAIVPPSEHERKLQAAIKRGKEITKQSDRNSKPDRRLKRPPDEAAS